MKLIENRIFVVAVIDLNMPGMSGIELHENLKRMGSDSEVVMLTGEATMKSAVEAIKLGAHDYLTKPAEMDELAVVVEKVYEVGRLRKENWQFRAVIEQSRPPIQHNRRVAGDAESVSAD